MLRVSDFAEMSKKKTKERERESAEGKKGKDVNPRRTTQQARISWWKGKTISAKGWSRSKEDCGSGAG